MSTSNTSKSEIDHAVQPQPSVHEHGENGYTDNAVGGFGANYDYQVAHGADSSSPGTPSDSELDASPTASGALAHAVQKAMGRAHIDSADLRVEAIGSEIHLHGSVRHSFEKSDLEARARAVPGVSAVVSELRVVRADWQENS